VNELLRNAVDIPLLAEEGGRAIHKMDPFRNRRGRGGQFGESYSGLNISPD